MRREEKDRPGTEMTEEAQSHQKSTGNKSIMEYDNSKAHDEVEELEKIKGREEIEAEEDRNLEKSPSEKLKKHRAEHQDEVQEKEKEGDKAAGGTLFKNGMARYFPLHEAV